MDPAELRARVAKLGLAAVLAYGLFDGVTYTTFFVLAFLGYEKSTGQNPAANLKALLGVSPTYPSQCQKRKERSQCGLARSNEGSLAHVHPC